MIATFRRVLILTVIINCIISWFIQSVFVSFAGENDSAAIENVKGAETATVIFKKSDKNEWRIYSRQNEYLGRLERPKKNLRLYDKDDNYTEIFINVIDRKSNPSKQAAKNKDWSLGDEFKYVATRTTSICINAEESRLYVQVMEAFLKHSIISNVYEIIFIDKKKNGWELFDVFRRVGKLEKEKSHFRLFNESMKFLGSIRGGCFRPKGAKVITRSSKEKVVTTITPEAIVLYLQVLKVIEWKNGPRIVQP